MDKPRLEARTVKAVHGRRDPAPDADFEHGLADFLRAKHERRELLELYRRYADGLAEFDYIMRRAIWRAIAREIGPSVKIEPGVGFKHLETFQIGAGVFIGANSFLQGRFDGAFFIGVRTWIGPQSYFDARALIIESDVGWGPGAKVLGSAHTGIPADVPIVATDLEIKPVRVGAEADIGVNAVILPGVTIGRGAMVGAGAVVREDVKDFEVVAGVPARHVRFRNQ